VPFSVRPTIDATPSLLHRVKRTKAEFQLPYRLGMSRHGAPVRSTHRMPLTSAACPLSAGRARHDRGEVDRKCAIPSLSDRSDSRLPPSVKAALESFTYEKTVNTA
jgi:hypothetical protein